MKKYSYRLKPIVVCMFVICFSLLFICESLISINNKYHFSFIGYGGTFKYHDLKIFGIPIYWVMLLCGFAATFVISWKKKEKYGLNKTQAIILPVIFLLAAYTGAKILYIIECYDAFKKNGLELSGLSLFGAIYLVLLATPIIALCCRKKALAMYDFFTPFGLILLACVRSGCFMNGCCGAIKMWYGSNPVILPVQLFEVALDLLILELCFYLEKKYFDQGLLYPAFMVCYGICRFSLEFLRDTPKDLFGLSHGQVFAIISVLIGSILLFRIAPNAKSTVNDTTKKKKNKAKR